MTIYTISKPLPRLPHPPTIINMKIGSDGVYVAATVLSISDFVRSLPQPMRMMYTGLRKGLHPARIAAYMGMPHDVQRFKAHLRQFATLFNRYWGRNFGEFVFDAV